MGPARGQDARPWGKKSSRKRKGSQQSLETDHPERIPVHPPQLDQSCPPHGAGTRGVTTSFGGSLGTESPSIAPKPPHLDQTCCKDLDAEELPHKAFPCQDEASHPDKRGENPKSHRFQAFSLLDNSGGGAGWPTVRVLPLVHWRRHLPSNGHSALGEGAKSRRDLSTWQPASQYGYNRTYGVSVSVQGHETLPTWSCGRCIADACQQPPAPRVGFHDTGTPCASGNHGNQPGVTGGVEQTSARVKGYTAQGRHCALIRHPQVPFGVCLRLNPWPWTMRQIPRTQLRP